MDLRLPQPQFYGRRVRTLRKGFSLVEVVLALAVVGFSLVGILSMFPLALDTARDSKRETRLALIAQTIFSNLEASDPKEAQIVVDELSNPAERQVVSRDLANFQTVYVCYNENGVALKQITQAEFAKLILADAAYAASVQATTSGVPADGLAKVTVAIATPPQVASGNNNRARREYVFSAYLPAR